MRRLPRFEDKNLLVGTATADDAGVYRIDRERALVQTVDFFTPIVDDPFAYGQIAAANALSDVYAMGGRPLTAMNLMGMPADLVPPEVIAKILRGGAERLRAAGCALVGGHSIRNPEPIYGLSVTGLVNPKRLMTNAAAKPGDLLVLTKPLGTGIVTTGIKRGIASRRIAGKAVASMKQLNVAGAELAEQGLTRAGVDVTGFGLLGHLGAMCRASEAVVEIRASGVPVLGEEVWNLIDQGVVPGGTKENLRHAEELTEWGEVSEAQRHLLADAQTSGGLLLCVNPAKLRRVMAILEKNRTMCAAVIGEVRRRGSPKIVVLP